MAFGMLVAAVVTAVMVTVLCYAAHWRKFRIVGPMQFIAALGATTLVGPLTVPDVYVSDTFWLALIISAMMPVLFLMLRVIVGRLGTPDEGALRHARGPTSQRYNW